MSARPTLPRPVAWIVVFTAVLAHLPALASYFAQDDWEFLARAAGLEIASDSTVRPWSTVFVWRILWPIFGLQAPAYHALAALLLAICAWLTARVGCRLGLDRAGAAVAGLLVAGTPVAILPIAWASATAELWGALFALAALDRWLSGRGAFQPFLALVFGALSLLSKENGLLLGPSLALALVWFGPAEAGAIRRGRWLLVALLSAGAVVVALQVSDRFAHGPNDPYALGGPAVVLRNLLSLGAWIAWPWRQGTAHHPALLSLGAALWLAMLVGAGRGWRGRDRVGAFALVWSAGSLLPVLALRDHLYPYYALLATTGWAWTVGWWTGPTITRWIEREERRDWAPGMTLVVAAVTVAAIGWSASRATMTARLEDGRIADPILRRSSIAAHLAAQIRAVPDLSQRGGLGILQATRVPRPPDGSIPDDVEIILTSPVFKAVAGETGLQLLLPAGVNGGWVTHLDELPLDSFVLLDAGEDVLHPLGDLTNARIYSALIAVSAGQFERGRHDLWNVLADELVPVRFAFDPDHLPVAPADLDREAVGFARYLNDDDRTSSGAVLHLFDQIYEAVRGRKVLRESWDGPQRAPRRD